MTKPHSEWAENVLAKEKAASVHPWHHSFTTHSLAPSASPRHVVLFRDLQLHLDQSDPMLVRRIKDILRVAKSNGHSIILLGCRLKLPPEFLRKGRFDELFFVDLPDAQERAQIWDIVIKRHNRKPADF